MQAIIEKTRFIASDDTRTERINPTKRHIIKRDESRIHYNTCIGFPSMTYITGQHKKIRGTHAACHGQSQIANQIYYFTITTRLPLQLLSTTVKT